MASVQAAGRRIRGWSQIRLPAADGAVIPEFTQVRSASGRPEVNPASGLRRDSLLVLVGNVVIGLSNYGFTLVLVWILPARQFSQVASVSALLLVAGTAAAAGIPWIVAREVARDTPDDTARRETVSFALAVALVVGCAAAAMILALSAGYASTGVEAATMVATPAVFVVQVGAGYLQGARRFRFFAVLMTLEAIARLAVGAVLASVGFGATGAVSGSAAGAVIAAAIAVWIVRKDLGWPRRVAIGMWQQLGGIGGIQVAVALLATLDIIVESVLHGTSRPFAGYQAMLVFTRIPLFVSGALSAVVYPRLAQRKDRGEADIIGDTTKLFLVTSAVIAALASSLPRSLLTDVLPTGYADSGGLLLPLSIAGVACGQINFSTTLLQARSAFRPALRVLGIGLPVSAVLLGAVSRSIHDLAWVAASVDLAIAAVLVAETQRRFTGSGIARLSIAAVAGGAALMATFAILRPHPVAWALGAALLCVVSLRVLRTRLLNNITGASDDGTPSARGPAKE